MAKTKEEILKEQKEYIKKMHKDKPLKPTREDSGIILE